RDLEKQKNRGCACQDGSDQHKPPLKKTVPTTPPQTSGLKDGSSAPTTPWTLPECKIPCEPSLAEPSILARFRRRVVGLRSARNHLRFNHSENARKIGASALVAAIRAGVNCLCAIP